MDFTGSQNNAINIPGMTLLVSAGAGSGKTTVLVERVIEKIKKGASIADFLIVTFTKASAADVREKLAEALDKLSAAQPGERRFMHQRYLLTEARIDTISAYCLSLVRENYQLLGISPNVSVIDETEESMYMNDAAEKLVTECYAEGSESFSSLADNFSDTYNDSGLIEEMIGLYRLLRVSENWREMLATSADRLEAEASVIEEEGFFACETGNSIKSRLLALYAEVLIEASALYNEVCTYAQSDANIAPIADLCDRCQRVYDSLGNGWDAYCACTNELFAPNTGMKVNNKGIPKDIADDIRDRKKAITDKCRDYKKSYALCDSASAASDARRTAVVTRDILDFLTRFDKRCTEAKTAAGAIDFSDCEGLALKLLLNSDGKPSEICMMKRSGIKELFIDEYQDVNPMQDRIFTLLSNGRNRFMVGDIKQSIYRFRNAYPDIFLGYKERFADAEDAVKIGLAEGRIFLKENFRCSESIISFVNTVFINITAGTQYFREYDGEWLVHASKEPEVKRPVMIAAAEYTGGKPEKTKARICEADYVAREIKRIVTEETDDKGEPIKYSDIAVMMSAMKGHSIEYEKALVKYGIPYKKEKNEDFLENPDIMLALAAMKAVDNPTDDISLAALMRSPICMFVSDELYRIRSAPGASGLFSAIIRFVFPRKRAKPKKGSYRVSSRRESTLRAKCLSFLSRLNGWRTDAEGTPCDEFLDRFFVSSGLMRICIDSGTRRSLLLLYELASRYEKKSYHGLSGFIDYVAELKKGDKTIPDAAVIENENAVSLITVHKSKGLEYKVCFVVNTDRQFSRGNSGGKKIVYHRGEGICFPLFDAKNRIKSDTLFVAAAKESERDAERGEEFRKLYVALTRAKQRLYITGICENDCFDKSYSPLTSDSWFKLLLSACRGESPCFNKSYIDTSESVNGGYLLKKAKRVFTADTQTVSCAEFTYPEADNAALPKKISVSELREGLLEDDEYNRFLRLGIPSSRVSKKPRFAGGCEITGAEKGTANHLFMQFCNFDFVEMNGVPSEAKRLLDELTLTPEQYGMLDYGSLETFFRSTLYAEIRSSKRVYREKRFSVSDGEIYSSKGRTVLVQGVIDCFFENPDGSYTVVDYKTDRIKSGEELAARHRVQLMCYCRAVESMTGRSVSRALLYSFCLGRTEALI